MKKSHQPDFVLFLISIILVLLGVLVLSSVSAAYSQEKFGNTTYFLLHQIIYGLLPGAFLGFLAYKISLSFLRKTALILLLINLGLMALVFIPQIGISAGGASRWLNLGFISFQPSEFLKITFILYLAAWLTTFSPKMPLHKGKKSWKYALFPFLAVIGVVGLFLASQKDVSTLGIIIIVAFLMYFLARTPLWHSILTILIGAVGILSLIKIAPYRIARVLVFLKPDVDPMGMGYQIKQALIAVGSGGIFGLGLGMSRQKFGFLPQSISDSIFAIYAEEAGLIGAVILISLFLVFLWRGFRISKKSVDKFSELTAVGITSWIVIQAFINIGSMIGIFPLTGIPLPFISYGGSALIAEMIGVGVLLNISKQTG